MKQTKHTSARRGTYHLEWFINSRCDYTCKRCGSAADKQPASDLPLDGCLEALQSFVQFARDNGRDATIAFYPRQAEFTETFPKTLAAAHEFRKQGLLKQIKTVTRGDVPHEKILLFQKSGVDACQLTIDGLEQVQDTLRRSGSFQNTLRAYREARAAGIHVIALIILVRFNAPQLADTMQLLLEEGFEDVILQVGIRAEPGRYPSIAGTPSKPEDPDDLWNQSLTAVEYRSLLMDALRFLDSVGDRGRDFRAKLIRSHFMFARLFHELGRWEEYKELCGDISNGVHRLTFQLRPTGKVFVQRDVLALGSFPGGSFQKMYESSLALKLLDDNARLTHYQSENQKEFAKCRTCPVATYCQPELVAASSMRLFLYPDAHCWVAC
ncbi:MAG: hypothetical protein HZA88_05160 [Verrucomicrobia bacterium]|nr:hypothetical protein [Verrucomicrobiota bacterium]